MATTKTTTVVKSNAMTIRKLSRSCSHIQLQLRRRDTELEDHTDYNTTTTTTTRTHSYISLADVMGAKLPTPELVRGQQLSSACHSLSSRTQSMQDIHNVHMKHPLVEKAARYYLATATNFDLHRHGPSSMLFSSSGLSSFFRIVLFFPFQHTQFQFHSFFGSARAWIKQQLYITRN
ncbi:unnamed protein product [Sphagnum troendelagicum]|uniref:Uncharacterized protein n=1 Tax=Sphagnum troendelagicum TaxID=128251 RepID=A0ABP0V2G5_9BRYO